MAFYYYSHTYTVTTQLIAVHTAEPEYIHAGHIDIPRPCVWEQLHRERGKDKTHTFAPLRTATKKEVATHCDLFLFESC